MLALVYIDRLIQQHNLVLSTLNVHRVIITRFVDISVHAASKVQYFLGFGCFVAKTPAGCAAGFCWLHATSVLGRLLLPLEI